MIWASIILAFIASLPDWAVEPEWSLEPELSQPPAWSTDTFTDLFTGWAEGQGIIQEPELSQPPAWSADTFTYLFAGWAEGQGILQGPAPFVLPWELKPETAESAADLFEEAGVTGMPTGIHSLSPIGLRLRDAPSLYEALTDEEARARMLDLLIRISKSQDRRDRYRNR